MNWYNGVKEVFEEELMDYFLQDRYSNIIVPRISANSSKAAPNNAGKWYYTMLHKHSDMEIMIVLDGQCILECENVVYLLEKGDIAITEENRMHRERGVCYNSPYRVAYFSIEKNLVRMFITSYSPDNSFQFIPATPRLVIKNPTFINLFKSELNYDDRYVKEHLYCYLKAFYFYIHRLLFSRSNDNVGTDNDWEIVIRIIDMILSNYKDPISIGDLCKFASMSESNLCNLFKKHMGNTLSQYINYVRVTKAIDLLRKTDKRIYEVAYEVGYTNQYYFTKVFKSWTGDNPSDFRQISGF